MDTRHFVRAAAVLTLTAFVPLSAQDGPTLAGSSSTRAEPRPMNWLDVQNMRQIGQPSPSPDGKWVLYTLSVPDWKEMRRQSDVYLVSTQQGAASTKRLTYTADKSETNPTWSRDGQYFVFLSDRDAAANAAAAARAATLPTSGPGAPYFPPAVGGGAGGASFQLYLMRPDGGEARKITDARDGGITTYGFTKDGRWLIYRSGQPAMEQLYALTALNGVPN